MTVGELIEKLKEIPADFTVHYFGEEGEETVDNIGVYATDPGKIWIDAGDDFA